MEKQARWRTNNRAADSSAAAKRTPRSQSPAKVKTKAKAKAKAKTVPPPKKSAPPPPDQRPQAEAPARSRRSPLGRSIAHWFALMLASALAVPFDLALFAFFAGALLIYATLPQLPATHQLTTVVFEEPLRVYTAQGSLMAEFGVQRRRAVSFADLPPQLIQAFIATEDSRFFDHVGVDVVGIGRAAAHIARTGAVTQGGSTITMQVARNFFLTRERTINRKTAELLLAMQIERHLDKEQILELYLNKIFFGHRAYGISAAAELYYQKSLDELTLAEMAMLAGIPKAPSANNPLTNPQRALERRNYILGRMNDLGFITSQQYTTAVNAPITATAYIPPIAFRADYVAEMVRLEMVERYGEERAHRIGLHITTTIDENTQLAADQALRNGLLAYNRRHGYHGPEARIEDVGYLKPLQLDQRLAERPTVPGLAVGVVTAAQANSAEVYLGRGVYETLTLPQVVWARAYRNENWRGPTPRRVTDVVTAGDVIRLRRNDNDRWELAQVPLVGGALVALSPDDGAIRALSGGYAFSWSKFNRAVATERQPGSSFKPFIYAAALDRGWTVASLVRDQPFERPTSRGVWRPRNADGRFLGPITVRQALVRSRNLAVVDLLDRLGIEATREYITRFGFSLDSMPPNLPLALGSGAASPLDMVTGFAVFANGGYWVEPYFIQRIEDVAGNVLFDAIPPRACRDCQRPTPAQSGETRVLPLVSPHAPEAPQVIDPRIAYSIDSILKDVITSGTGTRARVLNRPDIAGKTGTTNDSRDSWFVGYQPQLAAVSWMGMDDNRPLGRNEWGGVAALGIWVDFMREVLPNLPVIEQPPPEGMVAVRINASTGERTTATGAGTRLEYIPTEYASQLAGPMPVARPAPPVAETVTPPPRSTPRLIDELF